VDVVAVKVNDVKPGDVAEDELYHADMMRKCLTTVFVSPESDGTGRHEPGFRPRISAGKERYIVPEPDQFFGQPGDDPL
jgi:hypothetical protein